MRKFICLTALVIVCLSVAAWTPIGSGIQPAVRELITEIRDHIDPGTYAEFRDDFYEFPQATVWDTTSVVVDAGSLVAVVDSLGIPGALKWTLGNTSKGPMNGMNLQTVQAPFRMTASPANPDSATVPLEFETKFMVDNATQTQIHAGWTIEDESLGDNTYAVMLVKYDNTTTAYAKAIKATTGAMDSTSLGALANRTWYRLKIVWNGASAKFYLNGVLKATLSTAANFPTGVHLKPTIQIAGGDSVIHYSYIDYVWARQKR